MVSKINSRGKMEVKRAKSQRRSYSSRDLGCWVAVAFLLIGGIVASCYFRDQLWSLRLVGWFILIVAVGFLAALTKQGQQGWVFINEAKTELYRVVWPTKDETVKTTAVVAALVFVMAIVLWVVDWVLLGFFGWFMR